MRQEIKMKNALEHSKSNLLELELKEKELLVGF